MSDMPSSIQQIDDPEPPTVDNQVQRRVMCDKDGAEIKNGDILFYTERPYSNYADSLCHVYELDGIAMIEPLVITWEDKFMPFQDRTNVLPLENYSWDYRCEPTGKCPDMKKLGIDKSMATVEYANKHFPLDT